MPARPLYELAAGYNNLFELVLDDTVDLSLLEEGLESIECELKEKCANGIALIKSLEQYAAAYKQEKQRFERQQAVLENRIKRIKEWYRQNLDAMGKTKVPTKYGVMSVQNNGGKAPLKVDNQSLIPEEYLTVVPEHKEVNSEALYAALKEGAVVPGAHLEERGRSLRIR
ncbi:siphovirus Gp157 family protein [Selenomonas ruminantium]|uniref:Virus Gp157 n=1 Tax=Selenomonas ruminantium TaxID=971 RepID=A0A1I0V6M1_SELRU|nr:siphovirus Gp157 family protein [Selenomonas ruminantium]SFA71186.1 virus Gp157 [Selenomonas ruminantium]